jgi:predicted membrane channel-forming protein YqfA (hemolysin III family)
MMLLYCVVPAAYRILSRKLARAFLWVFDFPDICLLVAGTYTLCTLM